MPLMPQKPTLAGGRREGQTVEMGFLRLASSLSGAVGSAGGRGEAGGGAPAPRELGSKAG